MSMTTIMIIVWIAAAVVFAAVEAASQGLTSIWFAGGALCAGIAAYITDKVLVQIVVFLVISIILLIITRPMAKKRFNDKLVKTNVEAIENGITITEVNGQGGQVRADGKVWSAVTSGEVIEKDTEVKVKEVRGVTLIVERR